MVVPATVGGAGAYDGLPDAEADRCGDRLDDGDGLVPEVLPAALPGSSTRGLAMAAGR